MNFLGLKIPFPVFTKNKSGDYFNDVTSFNDWSNETSNLKLGLEHSILSPAILFISKLFSQAEFNVVNRNTLKPHLSHPLLNVLKEPNYAMTLSDLLESIMFTQIVNGVAVVWKKKTFGTSYVNSLYVLDFKLIDFPDEVEIGKYPNRSSWEKRKNLEVIYDAEGENHKIKIKDLIFFYDMPNGMDSKNPYNTASRIDGIRQTLYNTCDSEKAKSIIIKSNGKEMISGEKQGFPLAGIERENVENRANERYGLASGRRRTIVTNSSIKWQSMHIIMRDLGHDEGIKTDAGIIFAALHLPKDIYSIDGGKSTYKNANQSLVSYIQNEMQSTLESTIETLNKSLFEGDSYKITGSYDHLPVMLSFKTIKFENAKKQGEALAVLRNAGVPDELAIEICGLPKGTILKDIVVQQNQSEELTEDQKQKIKELIKWQQKKG